MRGTKTLFYLIRLGNKWSDCRGIPCSYCDSKNKLTSVEKSPVLYSKTAANLLRNINIIQTFPCFFFAIETMFWSILTHCIHPKMNSAFAYRYVCVFDCNIPIHYFWLDSKYDKNQVSISAFYFHNADWFYHTFKIPAAAHDNSIIKNRIKK